MGLSPVFGSIAVADDADATEGYRPAMGIRRHRSAHGPQSDGSFRRENSVRTAVAAARALHVPKAAPRRPPSPTPAEAAPVPPPAVAPVEPADLLALYRVPTFADNRGWRWMVPHCVSRYVLLTSLAERTKRPEQDGGTFEAHAMAMLHSCVVHVRARDGDNAMSAMVVGPKSLDASEEAHPDLHIVREGNRWATYDPASGLTKHVAASSGDSLYAALLAARNGREPSYEDIVACRQTLATFMLSDTNRESFAARAHRETLARLHVFARTQPIVAVQLDSEIQAYKPVAPPTFVWDGQAWPHPTCADAYELMRTLVRPMRKMGAWGRELETEAAAFAMGWRVHMWKPQHEPGLHLWPRRKTYFERVVIYGPEDGKPVHVVNIIDNSHFARFVPATDAWREATQSTLVLRGKAIDCGGGGNCLYYSLLGPQSTRRDVWQLRQHIVAYIEDRPRQYENVASEAVDILWNDFLISRPKEAARVAKQAEIYCRRQLAANQTPPEAAPSDV